MSALENCPTCKNPTSPNAETCPKCGEPLGAGWAEPIIAAREEDARREKAAREEKAQLEKEERLRILAERQRILKKDRIIENEKNQKKKKRRRIILGLIFASITLISANELWQNYKIERLKIENPAEYEKIMAQREAEAEARRLEKIVELERKVAAVPVSDYKVNIKLYKKLLELDPDSQRYIEKIEFYEAAQEEDRTRVRAAETAAKAEETRKGFHCLSDWDGSHSGVIRYVKRNLRDPDSFEHIETRITPVDEDGQHTLFMEYRARNGFGGMTVGVATAIIRNSNCAATVTSIE